MQGAIRNSRFIGTEAFSGEAGRVALRALRGNTLVKGDVNGDAVADFVIQVTGLVSFNSGDFLL